MLSCRFQGFWLIGETVKMILSSKKQETRNEASSESTPVTPLHTLGRNLHGAAVSHTRVSHGLHFPLTAGREPPTALHLDQRNSALDSAPAGAASHPTSNGNTVSRAVSIISLSCLDTSNSQCVPGHALLLPPIHIFNAHCSGLHTLPQPLEAACRGLPLLPSVSLPEPLESLRRTLSYHDNEAYNSFPRLDPAVAGI